MDGMRKFWAFIVYMGMMIVALVILAFLHLLSVDIFKAWAVAAGSGFGAFATANVVSKIFPPNGGTPPGA